MIALDPTGPAPETREPRVLWLLFACAAAPLAWTAQVVLAYGITAQICYPGEHPAMTAPHGAVLTAIAAVDVLALALCGAGAAVAWHYRARVRNGRNRLLALWGLMSSLWFFIAIAFNVIASWVPPCAG